MLRRPERYVLLFEVVVDFRVVPDELGEGFDDGQLYERDAHPFVRTKNVLLGHRGARSPSEALRTRARRP